MEMQVTYADISIYSKEEWRRTVKDHIRKKNNFQLIQWIKKYRKIDVQSLCTERCEVKDYVKDLSLENARINFRLRSSMCQFVQLNFLNKQNLMNNKFTCVFCDAIESQRHWQYCTASYRFRRNKNLENQSELIEFYKCVIEYRHKCEEDEHFMLEPNDESP